MITQRKHTRRHKIERNPLMTTDHIALTGPDDEIRAGHYIATATVSSTRRNLFFMEPGKERHVATLIAGSRSKVAEFEQDCRRIVAALAATIPTDSSEESERHQP